MTMASSNRRLLYIAYIWPESRSSAAGLRVWDAVRGLRSQGWQVTVASQAQPARTAEWGETLQDYRQELENQGFLTAEIKLNDESFEKWIAELDPRVVVYERFLSEEQFGARVRAAVPEALTVVDTSDLQSLRNLRLLRQKRGGPVATSVTTPVTNSEYTGEERKLILRELAAILRSDWTWVVSHFEAQWLAQLLGGPCKQVSTVRIGYPTPTPLSELPDFDARKNLVMIGNFRHAPNADAVTWFAQNIWPELRVELGVELHVYGAYPTREIMKLDSPQTGFRILGWVPDQYATLSQYRVSLAPLRFGAGIKGKILDSYWCGTPVVSTEIGFEGMFEGDLAWQKAVLAPVTGEHVVQDWVQSIKALYLDPTVWKKAQEVGRAQIVGTYLSENIWKKVAVELDQRLTQQNQERGQNLLQALLWQESLRSSEYFSRWIEAKNKLKPV